MTSTKVNSLICLIENSTTKILGFITFILLTRILNPNDLGLWITFVTASVLMEVIREGLIHTAIVKFSSGKSLREKNEIYGSGLILSLFITVIIALIIFLSKFHINTSLFQLFINNYPALSFITLIHSFSCWVNHSEKKFRKILFYKTLISATFFSLILFDFFVFEAGYITVNLIVDEFLLSNLICSLYIILKREFYISSISSASLNAILRMFHFGKYSALTLIAANLLRSSDLLLIGTFLGSKAVAIYSIPFKFIEIVEVPLRSFATSLLPVFSEKINRRDYKGAEETFNNYAGTISVLIKPLLLIMFLLSDKIILIFGGADYYESVNILKICFLFSMLLPVDRFIGILLDCLNKPSLNFLKVLFMLLINIVGDIIAIKTVGLKGVAFVSVFSFGAGILLGEFFLKKFMNISIKNIYITGFSNCKDILFRKIIPL